MDNLTKAARRLEFVLRHNYSAKDVERARIALKAALNQVKENPESNVYTLAEWYGWRWSRDEDFKP